MTTTEYKARFAEPHPSRPQDVLEEHDTRAGRALAYALDIRKFEIDLYWKRATYFWTFIGAAFVGYGITYKTSADHEPWLSVVFSSLGLVFSFSWYLVNRGSKFWQNNWERHVDLLENMTLGPLYKIVSVSKESIKGNPLSSPAQFSVSKVNQILSVFVALIWLILFVKALLPISIDLAPDFYKIVVLHLTIVFLLLLYYYGKSSSQYSESGLHERSEQLET